MRIAIVGGTFSPPHNGHVALALCARDGLNADRVLIMPNAAPPHKFCGVSKLDRREMTRLAFMDVKKTELDETELFSDGKSYTYETMAQLKALYPNDDLIFVIGGDSRFVGRARQNGKRVRYRNRAIGYAFLRRFVNACKGKLQFRF